MTLLKHYFGTQDLGEGERERDNDPHRSGVAEGASEP
jgi:hypothetical protein